MKKTITIYQGVKKLVIEMVLARNRTDLKGECCFFTGKIPIEHTTFSASGDIYEHRNQKEPDQCGQCRNSIHEILREGLLTYETPPIVIEQALAAWESFHLNDMKGGFSEWGYIPIPGYIIAWWERLPKEQVITLKKVKK